MRVTRASRAVRGGGENELGRQRGRVTLGATTTGMEKYLSKRWVSYGLIGVIVLIVWGQTIRFGFVWDDKWFVEDLKSIRSLRSVPEMFYSLEAQSSYPEGFKLFRPLRTVHYAVLYALGGKEAPQAWLFHLANVLWHAGAAMLLFSIALLLWERTGREDSGGGRVLALLIALGFAVHPVNSEVVCWVKSLDDIMAAVFTLAAARSLLLWKGGSRGYVAALVYFLLAIYSKESAVPFAGVAFLILRWVHRISLRRSFWLTAGFVAAAFFYIVHRHGVIGRSSQTEPISGTYGQTLIDMFPVIPKYFRLLWGVPPFSIDYSYLPGHHAIWSGAVLAGILFLAGWGVAVIWSRTRPDFWLVGFGLGWMGLFLLPVSNLVPMMQYMAERFLYLPLLGWLMAVGGFLRHVPRRAVGHGVLGLMVLVWIPLSWQRSSLWRDDLTLFVRSSQEGPRTKRVEENAVSAIFQLPQISRVFISDGPGKSVRLVALPSDEEIEPVLQTLKMGERLFPEDPNLATALGIVHGLSQRPAEAIPYFETATRIQPDSSRAWSNLGKAFLDGGRAGDASNALARALALEADNLDALRSFALLFWKSGNYASALEIYRKLKVLEPQNAENDFWIGEATKRIEATKK